MNEQHAAHNDSPNAEKALVAGHYRITERLGEGGIACVYRVTDERSGEALALKRLRASGSDLSVLRAMFELEYHTLVQLAHPHIVRVFDYGLDDDGAYYTMELLEGADARTTLHARALGMREICILLRDAASALALIHSRRLVHRDISPRNLWCMPDGRGKLIDFGTLAAMGPQTRIAGTPPFVPPEALYAQPLDARCDIFALGALAYYLLTKRNAYPAREMTDLKQTWERRPKRPDADRPDVPRALADLVMAMLNLDARGRPSSAAEVFERLTAIADLSTEDERGLAQAFLTSPKLVGRDAASEHLHKRLLRAVRGRGGTVSLVAPAGRGRSRMLTNIVLEAKLLGATVISADAAATGANPFALVSTLAERVLDALPMTAAAVVGSRALLGHVSPALHRAFGSPALVELPAIERQPRLTAALVGLFDAASRGPSLVITVDDVHRADGASLGVLAQLSVLARESRLLLATSCDIDALDRPPPALEHLVKPSNRVELPALDATHTRELLSSLFGEVPGLDGAASWLHELSQGSPQACMQYAQYLVDQRLAHYEGGQWKLPSSLRDRGLPATLDAMFDTRVASLTDDARALALGLALARDASRSAWQPETHVQIEDFPQLLEGGDASHAFSALDELLRAGMVHQRENRYVLAQRAMDAALLRAADAETRRRTHARLANIFEHAGYLNRFAMVHQLQRAGEHARARAVIVGYAASMARQTMDWGAIRVSLTAECAQNAIENWQQERGSARDGIAVRRMLIVICSVYDWSFASHGAAQIAQLCADSGLVHWDKTDALAPDLQRVIECLKLAQQEYEQKPENERSLNPIEAVRELASCAIPLSGACVNSHDVAGARVLPAVLNALRPLSPVMDLVADTCERAVSRVTGRELGQSVLAGAERLLVTQDLPDILRRGGAAVLLHVQAIEDARCGRASALAHMDRLAPEAGEDMFLVLHGRWLAHGFRGDAALAQRYRSRAEVITEDDVWRRRAFLFVEAQLHALTGNLPDLKRTSEAIADLAQKFSGWQPWLHWTRAALHLLRGELEPAKIELTAALSLARPGEHRAWILAAPMHAEVLLAQGNAAGALRETTAIADAVRTFSLDLTAAVAAARIAALAQSSLGDHEAARANIDRAFALARELTYDGLPLAILYEAQARTALAANRNLDCVAALSAMRTLLSRAHAPALVNAYEVLREMSSKRVAVTDMPGPVIATRTGMTQSSTTFTEVRTRLTALDMQRDRAQQALQLLLEDSGADTGHLFLFDVGGLYAAASCVATGDAHTTDDLLALAQQCVEDALGESKTVADVGNEEVESALPTLLSTGSASLLPVLLENREDGASMLAGLALLGRREARLHAPNSELVQAISSCLQITGDSIGRSVVD